jgi:non-lysosomal glucosylceramidase
MAQRSTADNIAKSNRRDFLKTTSMLAAGWAVNLPAMIGPFGAANFEKLVPAEKNLKPEWIKSLFARGEREVYRGAELEKIGMPIGGICTGQVYLGGDGKLWHWDVFNQHLKTHFEHYAKPLAPRAYFKQGFAVRTMSEGKTSVRTLDRDGFGDISFIGEYPIGYVQYLDADSPVAVSLEAYAPFIPLNPEASHIPATILQYTIKNTSKAAVECEAAGWLENATCLYTGKLRNGTRINSVVRQGNAVRLDCTAAAFPKPKREGAINDQSDFGSMSLGLLAAQCDDRAAASIDESALPASAFIKDGATSLQTASAQMPGSITGALVRKFSLKPGEQGTATFIVAWYFPNILHLNLKGIEGRRYGKRFTSAGNVVEHAAANFNDISRLTRLWHDTWYDSTLPYWFLDRTFANTSTLATSTSYWFGNDRFYGWEGVGFCEGTCTHVWQYAQAVARLFPNLERGLREMVDYGIAFHPDTGLVDFRAEFSKEPAIDGQAGVVLRSYREHQMSADDAFLRRNWPKIKKSLQFIIDQDIDRDGILDRSQGNTQDCEWFGKISWLSSLYVAALRAGEQMALEMGDRQFARQARSLAELGTKNIDAQLFNGEYYVQLADPNRPKTIGSYDGCLLDQVLGQSWAHQVGLCDRILPREHTQSALRSIWKYSFTTDIGSYRKANPEGRWFAMPGEGGAFLCTWPRGDSKRFKQSYDSYFNENNSGFEYQTAGHMIWEGLLQEGLAIVRTIHDRYHPSRRNPWNEIEAGDHYARAMASYGVYLAACGYRYHGPKGFLAFAPRLSPENFRAAFTAAEGWGTFSQRRDQGRQTDRIEVRHGRLKIASLEFETSSAVKAVDVKLTLGGQDVAATVSVDEHCVRITLRQPAVVQSGGCLEAILPIV